MARSGPLFSIVYHSVAVPGAEIDLTDLLERARARNGDVGVTGMLLAENGRFLQALEGPEPAVRSLMERIAADPRHEHVRVIEQDPIAVRRFPDWAMAEGHVGEVEGLPTTQVDEALLDARDELVDPPSLLERWTGWLRGAH